MAVSAKIVEVFFFLILRGSILGHIRTGRNHSDIFRGDGRVLLVCLASVWRTCEMPSQLDRMELTSFAGEFSLGKQVI